MRQALEDRTRGGFKQIDGTMTIDAGEFFDNPHANLITDARELSLSGFLKAGKARGEPPVN